MNGKSFPASSIKTFDSENNLDIRHEKMDM